MNRKIYIQNDSVSLAECIESDYRPLFDSWNEEDTIIGYNYRLSCSFDEYCGNCRSSGTWGSVIIRNNDKAVIGRVGISPGLPDLTVTVFKPYVNRGYGTAAFSLALKYCFEVLKLDKIYAGCYEDNEASRKMILKCGFKENPEGNQTEEHIFTGENRVQYDFVILNPLCSN